MDETSARFAEQLKRDPSLLKRLLQSSDGQALMRMLSQDGGNLRSAVQDASRGNPAEAMRLVNQFLQTPDGAALADRLQKTFGK